MIKKMSCEILEILIPIICIPNYHQNNIKKRKKELPPSKDNLKTVTDMKESNITYKKIQTLR